MKTENGKAQTQKNNPMSPFPNVRFPLFAFRFHNSYFSGVA